MRSKTVILVHWKLTGRNEHFVNLGKLFAFYVNGELSVSRGTLDRRDLYIGYQNDIVEITKSVIK